MDKVGDWLNSVPLFGVAGISFAVGSLYGKGFHSLEWETLIAGCLGLGGGAFAWLATKKQINHQIQVTADEKRTFARRFLQETKAQMEMIRSVTGNLIEDDFYAIKAQVEFSVTVLNAHQLRGIPAEIDDSIAQDAIELRQVLNVFTIDIEQMCANGMFDQGGRNLLAHQQEMIKEIDSQLRELIKAIENKLNS